MKLDIDKIIKENGDWGDLAEGSDMKKAIKEAIREVLPEILEYCNSKQDEYKFKMEISGEEILKNLGI